MKPKNKSGRKLVDKTLTVTSLVCLLPMIFSAAVYRDLPEQVAIHWGADGAPNGWAHKALAAFGLPFFLAALNVVCHLGSNSDPKGEGRSMVLLTLCKWIPAVLSVILVPVTLFIALGKEIPVGPVVCCIVGAVLIITGNYLPKCRQNYTMGIKLPWTLADEENWDKTHRLAGPLWILGGAVFMACGFFGWVWAGVTVIILIAVIPMGYSFLLSQKKN